MPLRMFVSALSRSAVGYILFFPGFMCLAVRAAGSEQGGDSDRPSHPMWSTVVWVGAT